MGSVELGLAPARRLSSWKPAPSARTEDFSASRNAARSPTGAIDVNTAYEQTLALLELPEPPTAIFSVNNIAVVGGFFVLLGALWLAVVSWSAFGEAGRLGLLVALSAGVAVAGRVVEKRGWVRSGFALMTIATQLLLDRIAGRIEKRRRLIVLPADFVVRESCGAAAGENT